MALKSWAGAMGLFLGGAAVCAGCFNSTTACGLDCVSPGPGCHYQGGSDTPCACGTIVCDDAGPGTDAAADTGAPRDVSQTDAPCVIACPPPPSGCSYAGVQTCSPPNCGSVVCPDAGPTIVCGAGTASVFPTFDRSCIADTDCFVALHQTDCCGDSRAMGLNVSQRTVFATDEALCDAMYPGCGCAGRPPVTDDGMQSTGTDAIVVHCLAGLCSTTVD